MLEHLAILLAQSAVQSSPSHVRASAQNGDISISQGLLVAGIRVSVLVDNAGAENDRLVSIHTSAGDIGQVRMFTIVDGRGEARPDGDLSIIPGANGVVAMLSAGAQGQPLPATITLVFERAGEMTVETALFVSPQPTPQPRIVTPPPPPIPPR